MAQPPEEIEQEMVAVLVEQSDLTDTTESARAAALMAAGGWQVAAVQAQIAALKRAFGFQGQGQALRDRCRQLPGFVVDLGASPAQGAVMSFTRADTSGELLVAAGSTFQTPSGAIFVLTADATFLDGEAVYPAAGQSYAYVVCSVPGTVGNVGAGSITILRSGPDGLIGCTNPVALLNGLPPETDAQIQKRALDYVAGGLTRLTPAGLRSLVLEFVASDGTRSRNPPAIWVDPSRPYAEILPDDGNGFAGLTRVATDTTGIVPANGQLDFWFEGPMVEDEVTLSVNGVEVGTVEWVTIAERGRAYLLETADIWSAGDEWEVSGHTVYIGYLRELQAVIEGLLSYLGMIQGYRATATRIRVAQPARELVEYDVLVVYDPAFVPDDVNTRVRDAIVEFHLNLLIGEPRLIAHLIRVVDQIPGVLNHAFRDPDDPTVPAQDAYPANQRTKLSASVFSIAINGSI